MTLGEMEFTSSLFIWNSSFCLIHPTWHTGAKWCGVVGFTAVAGCALTATFCSVLSYKDFSAKLEVKKISILSFEESLCFSLKNKPFLHQETWVVNLKLFLQDSKLLWYFNQLGLWQRLSDSILILLLSLQRKSGISKLTIVKAIILLAEVGAGFYKARIEVLKRNILFQSHLAKC